MGVSSFIRGDMAVKKRKGQISVNYKRYYRGEEVKPTRFVYSGGHSIMAGCIGDGEIIRDANGKVIPFKSI